MLWYLSLDTTPAKKMLGVLEILKKGGDWVKILEKVLKLRAYRYMLFSHNLSTLDLIKVLKKLYIGEKPEKRLKHLYEEFLEYLNNIDAYYDFIETVELEKNKVLSEACRRATTYLPEETEVVAKAYLVLGGSNAYGVNLIDTTAIVMNIACFLNDINQLSAILGHELHHKAIGQYYREVYWRLSRSGSLDLRNVYRIVSEIVGEGVASLVASPYAALRKYTQLRENIQKEYRKVEEGIIRAYEGSSQEAEEIFNKLYRNMGSIYMVGVDMSLQVENTLGKNKLVESLKDLSTFTFFSNYMKAVDLKGEGYYYSSKTIEIISELKEKIINLL
ncbi:MAG: hypothetical protein DRJ52_03830 [Thermoprotei archaeon]|nr:MAG: hypothetical protein DRJ52_03830 [Thermoprotei archaeon]